MAVEILNRPGTEKPGSTPPTAPLENGDLLTARVFLRRYEARRDAKKAELIEGTVYMGSPVRIAQHAEPDTLIQTWLGVYASCTPGVRAAGNATVRLDAENVPQPDALLRLLPECGGHSQVDSDGYLTGPPELIVEIAASSASLDLHDKLRAYRRARVLEYLIWRPGERKFDWLLLQEDDYRPNPLEAQGVLSSQTFPGLSLEVEALLALNSAKVLATLQRSLDTAAHAAFAARLKEIGKL